MRLLLSLFVVAYVCVYVAESCCLPSTFSSKWGMQLNMKVLGDGVDVGINATINSGNWYVDGPNDNFLLKGQNGKMIMATQGMRIPLNFNMEVGMAQGNSIWMKVKVVIPGRGQQEKCTYLRVIGDVPSGYACYLNKLEKLENDADGHRRFRMNVPGMGHDTVTVNGDCMMLREAASFDIQADGSRVKMDGRAHFSQQNVGGTKYGSYRRPYNCAYKDSIRLPAPSEEGTAGLLQKEMSVLNSRRRRAVEKTVTRLARETMIEFYNDLM